MTLKILLPQNAYQKCMKPPKNTLQDNHFKHDLQSPENLYYFLAYVILILQYIVKCLNKEMLFSLFISITQNNISK